MVLLILLRTVFIHVFIRLRMSIIAVIILQIFLLNLQLITIQWRCFLPFLPLITTFRRTLLSIILSSCFLALGGLLARVLCFGASLLRLPASLLIIFLLLRRRGGGLILLLIGTSFLASVIISFVTFIIIIIIRLIRGILLPGRDVGRVTAIGLLSVRIRILVDHDVSILPRLPLSIRLSSFSTFLRLIFCGFCLFYLRLLNRNIDNLLRPLTVQLKLKLLDEKITALLNVYRGAAVRDPVQVKVATIADFILNKVPEAVRVLVHAHGVQSVFVWVELKRIISLILIRYRILIYNLNIP